MCDGSTGHPALLSKSDLAYNLAQSITFKCHSATWKSPKRDQLGPRLERQVEGVNQTVPINSEVFTIGRGDSSSRVDYVVEDVGVSRIHAEIVQTSNGFQLRDAGSMNGTFLNEFPLVTYQGYTLKDGDIVRIIRQELTFRL